MQQSGMSFITHQGVPSDLTKISVLTKKKQNHHLDGTL